MPNLYYNVCGVYWKCQDLPYVFERIIMKQKLWRKITQSAEIKDKN